MSSFILQAYEFKIARNNFCAMGIFLKCCFPKYTKLLIFSRENTQQFEIISRHEISMKMLWLRNHWLETRLPPSSFSCFTMFDIYLWGMLPKTRWKLSQKMFGRCMWRNTKSVLLEQPLLRYKGSFLFLREETIK